EVGRGGPQAEEAMLTVHAAARIEGLHANVVEHLAAVHGRSRIRLGEDEQLRLARARPHVAAQHRDARATPARTRFAENPEARARSGHEAVFAATALETVVAITEKDEVPRLHPVEQVRSLAHFRRRQRRWVAFQAADDPACALAHRPPIAYRHA